MVIRMLFDAAREMPAEISLPLKSSERQTPVSQYLRKKRK